MILNIIKIVPDTIVDGPHYRTSIYFSGCNHKCPGCHNQKSWKYGVGKDYTVQEVIDEIKRYEHKYITFSGGDVFSYQAEGAVELVKELKRQIPDINIWVYTGYELTDLLDNGDSYQKELLDLVDSIVDGPFIKSLKSDKVLYRGSSNQIIWEKNNNGEFIKSRYN